jgi:hypothetical protein
MTARRLGVPTALICALLLVVVLGGCGANAPERTPAASDVPLVPGARIATQVRTCDPGASAFCSIQLVVIDPHYKSSDVLALDESHQLRSQGWSLADGDTGEETAANSPGHKLRLTFSTAVGDLRDIDLGAIMRSRPIALALSNSIFDRTPAMSMMLEAGAS